MADAVVRVTGIKRLLRLLDESDAETAAWLREGLVEIGQKVADDVQGRYSPYSERGAAGVKSKLTRPGRLVVAQTMRKSRNMSLRRRNFGGLMMKRSFLPALDDNQDYVNAEALSLVERLRMKWKEEGL